MNKCCVVIITHKEILDVDDERSFKQALNVFNGRRDIRVVLPDNISYEYYETYKKSYNFEIVKVNNQWLKDYKAYNKMCCDGAFYALFKGYEYILIYQTDCWVYEDRLDEFIEKGYDYYGAPWPIYNDAVGNGGFSLRKVDKMAEICGKYSYDGRLHEDGWICLTHKNELNICDLETACNFSMELFSIDYLKKMKSCPMGLHDKMNIELWGSVEKFIKFKDEKLNAQKKISVITVNLNNKEGLEKTINSVISQTYFNKIEYIIIDGGSTDGSVDLAEKHKEHISYFVSEKDNGVYDAMNKGVNVSSGEYCVFLNSGDFFHSKDVVELVVPYLEYDIVYGDLFVNGRLKKYPDVLPKNYFSYETLPHPSSFIRTSLIKKRKYDINYKIISDYIFFKESIFDLNKSYKHVNIAVSDFFLGGISSNLENVKIEKMRYADSVKYDYEICVIIPCYNQGEYVSETIDSLKGSSYHDFHCVIVNDGSTDNSEDVILSSISGDSRFEYFKNENHGLSYSRNFGISKTNSKYILCLDSDDKISSTYIENAINFLNENPSFSIYYGNAHMFYNDGREVLWKLPKFNYRTLLKLNLIYCSFVYRRKDYKERGGYDEKMGGYEDWEFLVRLLYENDNVCKTDDIVFFYRQHDDSMIKRVKKDITRYRKYIIAKNLEIYKKYFKGKKKENIDLFITAYKDFIPLVKDERYKIIVGNHEINNTSNLELINCKHDDLLDDVFFSEIYMYSYLASNYPLKDYVGFCHYRKYWSFMDDIPNMDELFKGYDAIVGKPIVLKGSVWGQYAYYHNIEDLEIIEKIIKEEYTEYYNAFKSFVNGKIIIPYNMFIMKKEDFLEYIKFVKSVLDRYLDVVGLDIEKRIEENKEKYIKDFSPNNEASYQYRIGGYLGERLTNVFLMAKFKKMKTYKIKITENKYKKV